MLEKALFNKLMSQISHGGIVITYPDGEHRQYGQTEPWLGMKFKNPKAIRAIFKNMSAGFAESYAAGLIEIDGSLDQVARLVSANQTVFDKLKINHLTSLTQSNNKQTQPRQIRHHYDLGNDFYKLWLDESMTYSCAYFKNPEDSLELAQRQKVEHILKKLQLKKGQSLLDIGSGWGTLLITAAKQHGVKGLGITLSREQYKLSRQRAKEAGVDHHIDFELVNYQDLAARGLKFDRIVSVGMFEHVGRGNHKAYYKAVADMLADDGISLLHSITGQTEIPNDPWVDKYIFPGGYIPSLREIIEEFPNYQFRILDYENLRIHYAMTLDEWLKRYESNATKVVKRYGEKFYRTWKLWLASSSGSFRYGLLDLSQIVFTKGVNNSLPLTREHIYIREEQ